KEQQDFMDKEVPSGKPVTIAFSVVGLVFSILLLLSGILLLGNKSMGRTLGIMGAILLILLTLADTVYTFVFLVPAMNKWEQQQANVQKAPGAPGAALTGAGTQICVGAIKLGYAATVIAVLMSGASKQFFSGSTASDVDELDRPRDEFDEYDRRDDYDRPGDR